MTDIEYRGNLLQAVNHAATLLLNSDIESFNDALYQGMKMIAKAAQVDAVYIWKNHIVDGQSYCSQLFEWCEEDSKFTDGTLYNYNETVPGWYEILSKNKCLNSIVRNMSKESQAHLEGILSILVVPVFIKNQFWGFVGFDDDHKERIFTETEISVMTHGANLIAQSFIRNDNIANIIQTQKKLEDALEKVSNAEAINKVQLAKLNLAVKAIKIGLWDMEIKKNDVLDPESPLTYSNELRQILGFTDENDFPNLFSSWSDRLHPEDKAGVLNAFEKHFADRTGKTPYDIEYRMLKKNGEYGYFHDTGTTLLDENKNPLHIIGGLTDITETKEILLDKERQRLEAEAASQAKSAFLSTMSHEIRTPMNAIIGITDVLLQNEMLEQNTREALNKIYVSGDMLLGIINDILDLSKIEAGKLELRPVKYEVASMISDTALLNIMRIGDKPIKFELHIKENIPEMLFGDELRIKQILNNLLSNAFKYTNDGIVKLSVYTEPGSSENDVILVLSVSDTGQGMTSEQLEKLFEKYSRFNYEANRTTEGTGLGMNITRNLVYMMKGNISVESQLGKGSTFTVRLLQGKAGSGVISKELAKSLHQFRTNSSTMQIKRAQITREYMPYGSVLVVDDIEMNIHVARELMALYGLKIDSANSGFTAIEKVEKGNVYDIIFMDHMMPKMDGMEATKIIRGMGYKNPIIALTANAVAGQANILLANGFDDFISKPIDVRLLNTILNKFIRNKQTPEIIEAARQQAEVKKALSAKHMPQPKFARKKQLYEKLFAIKTASDGYHSFKELSDDMIFQKTLL